MNRSKEIAYILSLGILFFLTVRFSLFISPSLSIKQRIPAISASRLELSAQPLTLMKELVGVEFFQVKNQNFLTNLKKMIQSNNNQDHLNGIQIDFHKPMSFILMDEEKFPPFLVHFSARDEIKTKKTGQHFVQIGTDVFYAPSESFTPNQINWLLKNVKWEPVSIQDKQIAIQQILNGKKTKGTLSWNKNQLHLKRKFNVVPRVKILQPRYFHISQDFPKKILSAISKDYDIPLLVSSLERFSINYDGGTLTSDDSFPFAASFEVLLGYENPDAMKQALNQFKFAYDTLKWEDHYVQMGAQHIYFQTIDSKTLYVCSDIKKFCPNGKPNLISCGVDFMCTGDLKRLTTVQNTGWAGLVLDMIPAFRASKELFDGTSRVNTNKQGIDITFKPGKMVLHELLNAMLVYGQE